jgi:hypothetical protein
MGPALENPAAAILMHIRDLPLECSKLLTPHGMPTKVELKGTQYLTIFMHKTCPCWEHAFGQPRSSQLSCLVPQATSKRGLAHCSPCWRAAARIYNKMPHLT